MRNKRFVVAALGVGLCVLACGVGWLALNARNAPFIAPSAINVSIADTLGDRLITYEMGDPEVGWSSTVARRLSLSGWRVSEDAYQWGTTERFIPSYTRTLDLWALHLHERAELLGDKRAAHIHIISTLAWEWP